MSLVSLVTGEDDCFVVELDFDLSGGRLVGWLDDVGIVARSMVDGWFKWSGMGIRMRRAFGLRFPLEYLNGGIRHCRD